MPRQQNVSTISRKTSIPILTMLLIIIIAFSLVTQFTILTELKRNSNKVFSEYVYNRQLFVQNELINRCTSISTNVPDIVNMLETTAHTNNFSLADIHINPQMNQVLLRATMDNLIYLLRNCGATEAFLILDGPATGQPNTGKAGIYIRNTSPGIYSTNSQTLLFERGVPALSKEWQLPLDSFWTVDFRLEALSDASFYTAPLSAARANANLDYEYFGYWSYGKLISESDKGIFSYSLPLIASDGSVLGVMGVGVVEDQFASILDYKELHSNRTGAYLLANKIDECTYETQLYNGISYNKSALLNTKFTLSIQPGEIGFDTTRIQGGLKQCLSYRELKLYSANTPFSSEKWILIGLLPESQLYQEYFRAERTLLFISIAAILLSILCVIWTNSHITHPIRALVDQVRRSNENFAVHLHRYRIAEIDELATSIESLSARVASAYLKISMILEMSASGIGVYEYKENENIVYYTQTLCDLLNWPVTAYASANRYADATEFCTLMEQLNECSQDNEDYQFVITDEDGRQKWIKQVLTVSENSTLGVLTDVTDIILKRKKIEYERDYDTLTNMFNRAAFEEHVRVLFNSPERMKTAALIMWDLDNLKYVNDTYGHASGDAYIVAFTNCLKAYAGDHVISARRSGDEFVSLIYGFDAPQPILKIVEKINQHVLQTMIKLPNGNLYKLRVSSGLAWYPTDTANYDLLLHYADFAMYIAKHNYKSTLQIFNPELYHEDRILIQGQEAFNNLLDNRLIRFMTQPIVSAKDGSVYGYEMLMRSSLEVFHSPTDILRVAHAQSKQYDVEVMVWFEATKTFVRLIEDGIIDPNSKIFINSISTQMIRKDMRNLFSQTFEKYLPNIVCELTEENQIDPQIMQSKADVMREWNSRVAIDNYGAGYNGQGVLLNIDPHIVKIDMNIIRGIDQDGNRRHLVQNLVSYAHERDILVVAMGVETSEEMRTLIELGVDMLQGYYLAKPSFNATPPSESVRNEIIAINAHIAKS